MEILICGTAASEGWPAIFCVCEACQKARALGGKNVRSRAAYMLDKRVRIDFGPDSACHQLKYGLAYEQMEHLLITHSHGDHFYPGDLGNRRPGFSHVPEKPLHLWGNRKVEEKFIQACGADWKYYNMEYHPVTAWQAMDLGGLKATAIPASHGSDEECLNYMVENDGSLALFGHDTGWYAEATWDFFNNKPFSLLILDCTCGSLDIGHGHMGCNWVVRARDEFERRGALAPDARVIATHFSHNGVWLHDELEQYFTPHGIEVACDGMRVVL